MTNLHAVLGPGISQVLAEDVARPLRIGDELHFGVPAVEQFGELLTPIENGGSPR